MNANVYELLALAMRYVFALMMVLIVLRGWRISVVDSARARRLRRLSPDTGIVGEIMVLEGAGKGERCAVTLEGSIGSARGADIRLRSKSVRARHAIYQMTEDGLFVRGHAGNRIRDARGMAHRELLVSDGERFYIGNVLLMLVLTDAGETPEELSRSLIYRRYHDTGADYLPQTEDEDDAFFTPNDESANAFDSAPQPPRRDVRPECANPMLGGIDDDDDDDDALFAVTDDYDKYDQ